QAKSDDLCSKSKIENLRKVYFETLNYENPKIATAIPGYEGGLYADVLATRDLWNVNAQGLGKNDLCRINSGLGLVYAAMYIQNTNSGILAGNIGLEAIPKDMRFTGKTGPLEILLARQAEARRLLLEAQAKYLWHDSLLTAFIDSNGFTTEV